jgi:hypothetical protein
VDSGEKMRFPPRTHTADVRFHDQTYDLKCNSKRTAQARTYGQCVTGKPYFRQLSHSSYFLVIELCFSRNRTDDKSFLSI